MKTTEYVCLAVWITIALFATYQFGRVSAITSVPTPTPMNDAAIACRFIQTNAEANDEMFVDFSNQHGVDLYYETTRPAKGDFKILRLCNPDTGDIRNIVIAFN